MTLNCIYIFKVNRKVYCFDIWMNSVLFEINDVYIYINELYILKSSIIELPRGFLWYFHFFVSLILFLFLVIVFLCFCLNFWQNTLIRMSKRLSLFIHYTALLPLMLILFVKWCLLQPILMMHRFIRWSASLRWHICEWSVLNH